MRLARDSPAMNRGINSYQHGRLSVFCPQRLGFKYVGLITCHWKNISVCSLRLGFKYVNLIIYHWKNRQNVRSNISYRTALVVNCSGETQLTAKAKILSQSGMTLVYQGLHKAKEHCL